MSNDSLDIIAREISHLKKKDQLDYADTKRLEILVKMQRLILNTPTEIIAVEDVVYTDREVLSVIGKDAKAKAKKIKAIKKGKKKVAKKVVRRAKKKKA